MFREIGDDYAFSSIASARSFPIVGQLVGQALRIGLLKIKLTLRHPEHKIVFQSGRFCEIGIVQVCYKWITNSPTQNLRHRKQYEGAPAILRSGTG